MLHQRKARLAKGHVAMSSAESVPSLAPPSAPRVGGDLRAARQHNGWEVAAVAASLRIRPAYLEAIEAGRVADLPGNTYALGFLRSYAATLGLDADEITRRFRAEVAEVNAKTELAFPAPVPDRGVPAAVVVVFGLIIAVGAYVGWYHFADRALPPRSVSPVPAKLARLADPTALLPTTVPAPRAAAPAAAKPAVSAAALPAATVASASSGGQATPADSAVMFSATVQPTAKIVTTPAASSTSASSSVAASPLAPVSGASAAAPAAPPAQGAATAPQAAAAAAKSPGTVIIRALSEAWVEVHDSSGNVIFTKLMHPGESWTVPDRSGLVLTTGNAGGTELLVNGKPAPSLGAPGMVERDQPLDPALIKAGALPAQIAAAAAQPGLPAATAVSRSTPVSP